MNLIYLNTFLLLLRDAFASHFRGGIITWRPVNITKTTITIDLNIRIGWRKNNTNNLKISSLFMDINSNITLNENRFTAYNGVNCTDISNEENWAYGQTTLPILFNISDSDKIHKIVYYGYYWLKLFNGEEPRFNLISKINLKIRNDTKKINNPPITSMFPLVRMPNNCPVKMKIPITDIDEDIIRCRWLRQDECNATTCNQLQNITLDTERCELNYKSLKKEQFYAIMIQIEDFQNKNSVEALSSTPLQFLIQTYEETNCQAILPTFVSPTKPNDECVYIPLKTTYNDIIVAKSTSHDIVEIETISPEGMWKSELKNYENNNKTKFINISWTPTESQVNTFCFKAITKAHTATAQRCIQLIAGIWSQTQKCGKPKCDKNCYDNGICSAPGQCICKTGWNGTLCDIPICTKNCSKNGNCTAPGNCTCFSSFSGKFCETEILNITMFSAANKKGIDNVKNENIEKSLSKPTVYFFFTSIFLVTTMIGIFFIHKMKF